MTGAPRADWEATGSDRVRNFPPGRIGVLLPLEDRRAAALGICMYTTSNPLPYLIQRVAHDLVRLLGARIMPTRSLTWRPVPTEDAWRALRGDLVQAVGDFDHITAYRRHQTERTGLTMTLVRRGRPVAVVKLRTEESGLTTEQRALEAVVRARPTSFLAPVPLGAGVVDAGPAPLFWSAQSAVFTRPHRPVLEAPRQLFSEISDALRTHLVPRAGLEPAHNDVTPWNLRLDHQGRCWLFDWEDCGLAPPDADRAYYQACLHALRGRPLPSDLQPAGVAHWVTALEVRRDTTESDRDLTLRLLGALSADEPRDGRQETRGFWSTFRSGRLR